MLAVSLASCRARSGIQSRLLYKNVHALIRSAAPRYARKFTVDYSKIKPLPIRSVVERLIQPVIQAGFFSVALFSGAIVYSYEKKESMNDKLQRLYISVAEDVKKRLTSNSSASILPREITDWWYSLRDHTRLIMSKNRVIHLRS